MQQKWEKTWGNSVRERKRGGASANCRRNRSFFSSVSLWQREPCGFSLSYLLLYSQILRPSCILFLSSSFSIPILCASQPCALILSNLICFNHLSYLQIYASSLDLLSLTIMVSDYCIWKWWTPICSRNTQPISKSPRTTQLSISNSKESDIMLKHRDKYDWDIK